MVEIGDVVICKKGGNELIFRVARLDEMEMFKGSCDSVEVIKKAENGLQRE